MSPRAGTSAVADVPIGPGCRWRRGLGSNVRTAYRGRSRLSVRRCHVAQLDKRTVVIPRGLRTRGPRSLRPCFPGGRILCADRAVCRPMRTTRPRGPVDAKGTPGTASAYATPTKAHGQRHCDRGPLRVRLCARPGNDPVEGRAGQGEAPSGPTSTLSRCLWHGHHCASRRHHAFFGGAEGVRRCRMPPASRALTASL